MFTGIVQTMGVVRSIRHESPVVRLSIDSPELKRPIDLGASICVNGVCLTVTAADERSLEFDVIPETLSLTTLGGLRPGDRANIEASLRAGDRMDGHVVQGHVDGVAQVAEITGGADGHVIWFEAGPDLLPYIIHKGSVAIDGVSLTVAGVEADKFNVALIPTTLAVTTLGSLKVGDRVNVETDILARTVVGTLERWRRQESHASPLTVDSLRENGWA